MPLPVPTERVGRILGELHSECARTTSAFALVHLRLGNSLIDQSHGNSLGRD